MLPKEKVVDLAQVEGRNPVLELLRSNGDVRFVQVAQGLEGEEVIQEILRLAEKRGIQVKFTSRQQIKKLSLTDIDQGVIAFTAQLPTYVPLRKILKAEKKDIFVIVLDEVQDPQNLGSILRSAEATGVNVVVIPKRGSVGITAAVHRVSMGGSAYVPVARENLFTALKLLKEEGVRCVATDPSGSIDYFEAKLTGPLALVLGGEDKGVSPVLLAKCDLIIRIPMMGRLTSLNVGVATAIVMYERVRQQKSD
ncbi:MAG: rRNA (guanosine2251-2-O)-methyltransferase [Thermoproteota archaeon]|nr:rRNA (guanosine2251-2-O)-methyltransferase [Thermoproteota archaeon]